MDSPLVSHITIDHIRVCIYGWGYSYKTGHSTISDKKGPVALAGWCGWLEC